MSKNQKIVFAVVAGSLLSGFFFACVGAVVHSAAGHPRLGIPGVGLTASGLFGTVLAFVVSGFWGTVVPAALSGLLALARWVYGKVAPLPSEVSAAQVPDLFKPTEQVALRLMRCEGAGARAALNQYLDAQAAAKAALKGDPSNAPVVGRPVA
jgi:hypothetical protein